MDFVKTHPWLSIFGAIGLCKLGGYTLNVMKYLYRYCIRGGYDLLSRYGNCWAVVTGATGGIGEGYCKVLASLGFHLVLVGRNQGPLEALQAKLVRDHPFMQIKWVVVDFVKTSSREWSKNFMDAVKDVDVGLLVNVAGAGHGIEYQDYPFDKILEIINVTALGVSFLTRLIVPKMLARENRSGILNISSICSSGKQPYVSVYCATRAFLDAFALSLHAEVKDKIDVTTIQCGGVVTQMSPVASIFHTTPETAARSHLRHLGCEVNSHGYWKHPFHQYMWDTSLLSGYKMKEMRGVATNCRKAWGIPHSK